MKYESKILRTAVMYYFRYEKQCPIVTCEQGIGKYNRRYRPDVLVVNSNRKLIEIEIKTSLSDFKNDRKKKIWKYREMYPEMMPYQFYYCVPENIVDKVKELLVDTKFGLLKSRIDIERIGFPDNVRLVKRASPFNVGRLSFKDIVLMVKNQSSTLCRNSLDVLKNCRRKNDEILL